MDWKEALQERNKKIIEAVIKKAERDCPGSLALIGVYGSFATGDVHEKSDLDLLIVINDDDGWQLGSTFIQEDLQVGHDIYCTKWGTLEEDAKYLHPNIGKLMDARIVYWTDDAYPERLYALRKQVADMLQVPFCTEDFTKAENHLREAEHFFTEALTSAKTADVLENAGEVIYCLENAVAMLNKTYFRCGVKRAFEELETMRKRPENLTGRIEAVISTEETAKIKENLILLMRDVKETFRQEELGIASPKEPVSGDGIRGSYEEMYSNWRNKMYLAAEQENRHLAFMSMCSLAGMLRDIESETAIAHYDVLGGYKPQALQETAELFDRTLEQYLQEYKKAGIDVKSYPNIDAFVEAYLGRA